LADLAELNGIANCGGLDIILSDILSGYGGHSQPALKKLEVIGLTNHRKCEVSPLFLLFTVLFVTCLLIANIIAGKLIQVSGNILPTAIIIFPVTYIFGDIFTEVYGFERARLVIWIGFAANLLMAGVFMLAVILPYPSFWEGQAAYGLVLGTTPRMVVASFLAYIAGEFSNSFILSRLKVCTRGKMLWMRTIGSTIAGEGIDTILFITVAFIGSLPLPGLGRLMISQYLWKVGYEIAATPLTYLLVRWVKRKEGLDIFDNRANYNPFRLEVQND
jgi:uncharacterized integral membrane protein (TIGR00697 family)